MREEERREETETHSRSYWERWSHETRLLIIRILSLFWAGTHRPSPTQVAILFAKPSGLRVQCGYENIQPSQSQCSAVAVALACLLVLFECF